jgi:3D-(3,5/4)-trihydroxycyclohexane-1,2-dione acylhydrolase (decyclizing)
MTATPPQDTTHLTMAQALVRHASMQYIDIDGQEQRLFGGVFAIFGHGNIACLGEALYEASEALPTWRGQNEQSMALAAVAYAKTYRRRRIMIATSSIGPGATNMITAAAVAHTNRLPLLLLSGDTYHHRLPDPVLQQVEHFYDPSISVNDAFKPVCRYWDRITHPAQLIQSLPAAIATMLDPADCGPAFLGLPQDVQGTAYDYPNSFFGKRTHRIRRARPDREEVIAATALIRQAKRPLIIAGGGVHYSLATTELAAFADRHSIPVVETTAGRAALLHDHPCNCGPIGVTGSDSANELAGKADVVLAVGTRLQDFTTGSWTVFGSDVRIIGLNVARADANKHMAVPFIADAREGLTSLDEALGAWRSDESWTRQGRRLKKVWTSQIKARTAASNKVPSYAQVIGAVNRLCGPADRVLTAAGGLPAELAANWRAKATASVDIEFGYSCMGYEIAGGWGARMAQMEIGGGDTIVLVGDGSYLMLNSDIYSSVLSGRKLIVVVCDNGGFAVIDKLQRNTGNAPFNNLIDDCKKEVAAFTVDFVAHARSMGARAEAVLSIAEFTAAFARARACDRTYVIEVKVDRNMWTEEGHAWWEVGMPEVSRRKEVMAAAAKLDKGRTRQRKGV